ncbi:MAG: hypothetical protein WD426_19120 [Anditalea sp.]
MMKAILTILISMTFLLTVKGQEKKDLAVSVSTGLLNSPTYENASARGFFKIDFDYHLTRRHIVTAIYLAGEHYYYDDVLSNDPTGHVYKNGTNSRADYRTFSGMYKYKVIDNSYFSIVPGAGVGVVIHSREYPYREASAGYTRTSIWSDLVFPINLDINYILSSRWQFGLTGGFLIHPDYPIFAFYGGPKVSFVLP